MNIFNFFSNKIKKCIIEHKEVLNIEKIDNSLSIQIESPPIEFNSDLSTNIAMVLGKLNKKNPKILAVSIKKLLESKFKDFKSIEIAGSGFLNINLSDSFIMNFVNLVLKDQDKYGSNKLKKYNIEFVSANPTGPLHVGRCRGAIYGDVLANLIKFNGGNVVKEYYINDYGSQILILQNLFI